MMDGRRMDLEGGRVLRREKRARKLAAVVAVQNVLVVACLLVTLYGYWGRTQEKSSEKNIHIEFGRISDVFNNEKLSFDHVESSYQMSAVGGMINISCSGPYFLKMDVCYKSLDKTERNGTLQLEVLGREAPASSFTLKTSDEDCTALDWTVQFRAGERAALYLNGKSYFRIKNASLSLTYLLGRHCQK